jgi:hypothetical protein
MKVFALGIGFHELRINIGRNIGININSAMFESDG